ncbi:Ppx/GppA family phosphatase [Arcobacter sp.]|uniref:Ppx/GppA phosphatase family protein n=1 Tax=Arcobacter sp. TaxID=1872629 RepID=UPI003D11625B
MAKVTTIIDIGSNSMRMVVMQKSSRFAFHLVNETKARVKISEGSYENGGNLQEVPMQRAFNSLKSFLNISKSLKSRKIFCVATSAMRDAPNSKIFVNKVKNELGLDIKIIDGSKEAYYGGVAALNLINANNFITVDIGGGSTEFAIVKNGNIEHVLSLNIGTVRLSELYFSKGDIQGAKNYILNKLEELKTCGYEIPEIVIGIGGSIRALSKIVMKRNSYPLDVLHGFSYDVPSNKYVFDAIINAKNNNTLKVIGVKKERFDTIKEGTFIFNTILEELNIKQVITSGAGVREGVYLTDLLRNSNCKFPSNFNVSVRSLLDRFEVDNKTSSYNGANARKIFDVLKPIHQLDDKYRTLLVIASKLHSIGNSLNFYKGNDSTADFILNGLNYDFLHSSRVTVAHIIKFSKKSLPMQKDITRYRMLLPSLETMQWLSFMISLNLLINNDLSSPKVEYNLKDSKLCIDMESDIYLVKSELDKLQMPKGIKIKIK